MKRLLPAVAVLLLLVMPAAGQDSKKGATAFELLPGNRTVT
jgi:hypothetical protein